MLAGSANPLGTCCLFHGLLGYSDLFFAGFGEND